MKSSGVKSNTVSLSVPIQAKYDKAFYCTGYYTSLESDWSGEKVAVDSLGNDAYKKAFLEDTKMNGSGKAENGKYLHYDSTKKTFSYVNPVTVTGTTPTAGRTIAVDSYYVPRKPINGVWKRATVSIANIGTRTAEDGGGAINGYHIDVYLGLGNASRLGWTSTNRVVTLLSIK